MEQKPFPWKCPSCRRTEVWPAIVDYEAAVDHDGESYVVRLPSQELPRCRQCGTLILTDRINHQISDALRGQAKLMSPEQIRCSRESLGLSQKELANAIGVAEETMGRWEIGAQMQQRCLDRFMRAYFNVPELREFLVAETNPDENLPARTSANLAGSR